jgi:hypothetical protein
MLEGALTYPSNGRNLEDSGAPQCESLGVPWDIRGILVAEALEYLFCERPANHGSIDLDPESTFMQEVMCISWHVWLVRTPRVQAGEEQKR